MTEPAVSAHIPPAADRVPRGVPAGGQFTTSSRGEAVLTLLDGNVSADWATGIDYGASRHSLAVTGEHVAVAADLTEIIVEEPDPSVGAPGGCTRVYTGAVLFRAEHGPTPNDVLVTSPSGERLIFAATVSRIGDEAHGRFFRHDPAAPDGRGTLVPEQVVSPVLDGLDWPALDEEVGAAQARDFEASNWRIVRDRRGAIRGLVVDAEFSCDVAEVDPDY